MTTLVSPGDQKRQDVLDRKLDQIPDIQRGPTTGFIERLKASFDKSMFVDSINSEDRVETQVVTELATAAEQEADVEVPNYKNPEFSIIEAAEEVGRDFMSGKIRDQGLIGSIADATDLQTRFGREAGYIPFTQIEFPEGNKKEKQKFFEKMQEAYQKTGKEKFNITPEDLNNIVQSEKAEEQKEYERVVARSNLGELSAFTADITGAMPPLLANPWDIGTLGISAPASTRLMGSKIAGQIATDIGVESLVELGQMPGVQETREKAGLHTSPSDYATNLAAVGLGTGVLSGLGQAGRVAGVKINKHFANKRQAQRVARELVKRKTAVADVEVADRILSMDRFVRRTNPYASSDMAARQAGASLKGLGQHVSNIQRAQENILNDADLDVEATGNPVDLPEINRMTRKVTPEEIGMTDVPAQEDLRMDRVNTKIEAVDSDDIDFTEQVFPADTARDLEGENLGDNVGVKPVLFRKENGDHIVLKGREQIATGPRQEPNNAVVIDGRENDLNDARAWVMGKQAGVDEQPNVKKPRDGEDIIMWESEDGRMNFLEGEQKARSRIQRGENEIEATILRNADGIDEQMAKEWTAAKRYAERKISREEFAEILGKDPDDLFHPKRSQFVKDGQKIRDQLEDEAFMKFKFDEDIRANVAAEVAERVDPTKQTRALEATKSAKTKAEARLLIERGNEKGFNNIEPASVIGQRNEVRQSAIQQLRTGDVELRGPSGETVEITDGKLARLRELSQGSNQLSETLNRAIEEARSGGEPGTRESAGREFLGLVQRKIEDGDLKRDAIRPAKGSERPGGEGGDAVRRQNFQRDVERGDITEQIRNDELRELDDFREYVESNNLEGMRMPDPKGGDEPVTFEEGLEKIENDKKTLEELRDCAL